jgi:DNA-binding FadR family transcriptional regulator
MVGRHSGSQLAYRLLVQVGNLALWQQRVLSPGNPHTTEQSLNAHRILVSAIRAREAEVAESAARMIVIITRNTLEASDFQPPPPPEPPPKRPRATRA